MPSNDATMMKTFATASVVLLFVLGASSARAGFDEGLAAPRRGGYATALREYRPLAQQRYASAPFTLGSM